MQASLRSNYQYYDYGTTIDCTTRPSALQHHQHISPVQSHPQLLPPEQSHQLMQAAESNSPFDQQQTPTRAPACYTNPQRTEPIDGQLLGVGTADEQIVVYGNPRQSIQYQQLESDRPLDSNGGACNVQNRIENLDGIKNHYQEDCQQPLTQANYQTIYYEPLNYVESCQIEHQQHQLSETPVQTFAGHSLGSDAFAAILPQSHLSSLDATHCNSYFHYHQPTHELVACQLRSPQPLVEQTQNYENHQHLHQHHVDGGETAQSQTNLQVQTSLTSHLLEPNNGRELADLVEPHHEYQQLWSKSALNYPQQAYNLDQEATTTSIGNSRESHSSAASTSSSEESFGSTLTRDEKRAREANIPLTYHEIVNLSIDQFNEQLARHNLTESQLTLIKDIRRRGKNKVAAQSCRKRKMEQIYELQHEVNQLVCKRRSLDCECAKLVKEHENLVQEYDKIYTILQDQMQQEKNEFQ